MKKIIKYMIITVCSFSILGFTGCINNTDNSSKASLKNRLKFKENIILDLNYGKVDVKTHDEDYIALNIDNNYKNIDIITDGDFIKISEDYIERIHNYRDRNIEVLVPNKKIKSLNFTIDAGKVLIEDISVDDISIKNSSGDTNVKLYDIENFNFKGGLDTANIKIESVSNMNIGSDVGNMNIEVDQIKNEATISSNVGSIYLKLNKSKNIDLSKNLKIGKVSLGNNIETDGDVKINVKTNIGQVVIE